MRALLTLVLIALFLPARADLGVNIMTYGEACNNVDGRITASGYGGVPPYSYAWAGPGGFTANTAYLSGLESGIYTLTLTDSQGGSVIMDAEVIDYPSLPYGSGGGYVMTEDVIGAYGYPCEGLCNAAMAMVDNDAAGTSPFEYGFTPGGEYLGTTGGGHPVYGGFCPGDYVEYMYVDANGCTGSGAFTVVEEYVDQMPTLSTIQGSCSGASDGSVLFLPGFYQSTYTLSQYGQVIQSAPNVSGNFLLDGLAPGVYSVSIVTEHIQCTHTEQFTIPDLGTGCGALTGSSWYDVNEDCVQDPGEVGLPLSVLSVEPGGYHAITHGDGSFHLALPDGNYTIANRPNAGTVLPGHATGAIHHEQCAHHDGLRQRQHRTAGPPHVVGRFRPCATGLQLCALRNCAQPYTTSKRPRHRDPCLRSSAHPPEHHADPDQRGRKCAHLGMARLHLFRVTAPFRILRCTGQHTVGLGAQQHVERHEYPAGSHHNQQHPYSMDHRYRQLRPQRERGGDQQPQPSGRIPDRHG
ncbi:MAG: SprB repeat-containing protein [Flavobacteriales bacterium]|nr:SprB repeat-containing protein [Flavobacteriales bacterium]